MKATCTFLIALWLGLTAAQAQYRSPHPGEDAYAPYTIQVALLLDASGSMDGLIDQAKSRLWHIVNDMSETDSRNQMPILEFALYEYGRSTISRRDGYMRQVVPFTRDLDWLAEELFRLRTGGGDEYCGGVIQRALYELDWSTSPRDLRFIYIAGNESFRQGPVSYQSAIREAYTRDVFVNTIFCGNYNDGIRLDWEEAAYIGGGVYTNIDQNNGWNRDNNPYYGDLYSLNQQFNQTYIPYGSQGEACRIRQQQQDSRMSGYGQTYATERYIAKASPAYNNAHWDLVDAVASGKVQLEQIPNQDLPAVMQRMSLPEKRTYVAQRQAQRLALQTKIRKIPRSVSAPVASAQPTAPLNKPSDTQQEPATAPKTLDKAIQESVQQKKREMETSSKPASQKAPAAFAPGKTPAPADKQQPQVSRKVPAPQTLPQPGHQQSDPAKAMPAPALPSRSDVKPTPKKTTPSPEVRPGPVQTGPARPSRSRPTR